MYYYCNDCNQFITPILADDEAADVCMYCKSEDIEKVGECKICGLPIRRHDDYCEECTKLAEHYIFELSEQLETTLRNARDLLLAVMEKEK